VKVVIAVFGKFFAFYLAEQLQNRKYLKSLISTYPKFAITKQNIDPSLIRSLWWIELLSRGWGKLPKNLRQGYNINPFFLKWFDIQVSDSLQPPIDLFIGWSGACLKSLQRAKALGAKTVLIRGSTHIAYQTKVLEEEYGRWGLKFTATHPEIYQRELAGYQEADIIDIPSSFVKQTFLQRGFPEEKMLLSLRGVSLEEFYPEPKEDSVFRVIHCGALSLRKGVQYLLEAFYKLSLPDSELWLVGTVTPEILPFLKKYQHSSIVVHGKQPQAKLRWFYSQCSVFCLASIEEGLATVQLQAMACGLPIIHTPNTGGEDLVREGIDGFCFPIRNIQALQEKILFLSENLVRCAEMGQSAQQQAQKCLAWSNYAANLVDSYQRIVQDS
jgi:glycosyltransferase involved in cell wall biosynthesis